MPFSETWDYLVLSTVIYTVCTLISLTLLIRHLYLLANADASKQVRNGRAAISISPESLTSRFMDSNIHQHIIHYGTILSVSSFTLFNLFPVPMRFFGWAQSNDMYPCGIEIPVAAEMWVLAKYSMYGIFVARLVVAYRNTPFCYSPRFIISLYTLVVAMLFGFVLATPFMANGSTEDTDFAADGRHVHSNARSLNICISHMNKFFLGLVVLADVVFALVFVTLFTRPLKKLFSEIGEETVVTSPKTSTTERRSEMRRLPLKYTVLTATAVISTLLAVAIVGVVGIVAFTSIDSIVNIICLLFMCRSWKGAYVRICEPMVAVFSANDAANAVCCGRPKANKGMEAIVKVASFESTYDTETAKCEKI